MFLIGIVALCLLFHGQILNSETDQHGGQETKPGGEMEDDLLSNESKCFELETIPLI